MDVPLANDRRRFAERQADADGYLCSALAKLEGAAARFSLIFRLVRWADTGTDGFVYDGHNTMTFDDPNGELGGGALAACMPYYNTAQTMQTNGVTFYRMTDADIVFNNNVNFGTNAEAGAGGCFNLFDIEGVATHEQGHLVGLDHSPVFDATMYYAIGPCDATKITLEESDINGVTFIYP